MALGQNAGAGQHCRQGKRKRTSHFELPLHTQRSVGSVYRV
jgi:hypothetical protein